MAHFKTIELIKKRILELKEEVKKSEAIMTEPELMSDYIFAESDKANFKSEIKELRETAKYLIKSE